jgi:CHAD domain-containing protein
MVSTHREVERKYDASPGAALPDLGSLAGVSAVSAPEQHELEAVYFDTADLRLAAARITLRRRTGGEDAGWHLKLPLGSGTRDEVRLPLGRAKVAPPRRLRSAVLAFTRGEPLVAVATIRTSRTVRHLLAEDGSHLAEVCEDDVTAFAGSQDHSLVAWREWEVELVDGDGEMLDRVDAVMESAGAAVGRSPSKLARVLGDRVTSPAAPSARRKGPAGQVLQARLAEQVAVLKRQDVDVRLDVHDGVHQLRVAMRRLRSALATFRPLVDRERTDPLRDELRWIAGLLGEARDAEVMARRLDREVSGLPVELVLGAVTARIDHTLGTRYREGLARAVEAMESQRYLDLLADLDRLVADPPWTPEAGERAEDVVPALLRRDRKRLRRRVAALEPEAGPQGRDTALHECRKAAKGLRYAAEAADPVLGKRARRVRRAAKKAQTVLGEHQDTVVTRQALREMGVAAQLDGDSAFTFGLLYGREERRAAALQEEFARAWESELGPALRRGVP